MKFEYTLKELVCDENEDSVVYYQSENMKSGECLCVLGGRFMKVFVDSGSENGTATVEREYNLTPKDITETKWRKFDVAKLAIYNCRNPGFYWVTPYHYGLRTIGFWDGACWKIVGSEEKYNDSDMILIFDEKPINTDVYV